MKEVMMKNSPMHLNYDASDYGIYEYDPQFLEEARQHAKGMNFHASSTYADETGKGKRGEEKKMKKSWKKFLFSWLHVGKKCKPSMEPANTSYISRPKKGHVSGPIYGTGREEETSQQRPTSGPIANFFNPIRKVENEIPYICLEQLNNPHHVRSYGPVYLVT